MAEHLQLPEVTLQEPSDGSVVVSGAAVSLAADATDPGAVKLGDAGSIAKVEWFVRQGDVLCEIGEDTSAPYAATWTPADDGAYAVFARAT